jgi:hypothetical protein
MQSTIKKQLISKLDDTIFLTIWLINVFIFFILQAQLKDTNE